QEESYGSDDMAYNHYLEEARKKTQERNRNSKSSVKHTTSLQNTTNGSKQKPRSNNQTSRSLLVSNSSCGMSNGVPLVDHSRNSSSFSDSKHFVCLTCQKCVFNANHDACLTKFLKEVNSRIKVPSPKTRNNIKPVEKKSNVIKPKRWISKGYRISPNKSSAMHEKPNTLRSCLRWKPTGALNLSAGTSFNPKEERLRVWLLKKLMSKNQVPQEIHKQEQPPNGAQVQEVVAPRAEVLADSPVSISINQDASLISFEESPKTPTFHDDLLNESPQDSTSQGSSSNVIQILTSFEHLGRWTKDHPIANVIGGPSRSVSTRKQLETDAMVLFRCLPNFSRTKELQTSNDRTVMD
nr:integrase, catalytic region, zinc finger, CCHC-type, peptidase aspartic, catalytic [Tanacetum cinerariifolium]